MIPKKLQTLFYKFKMKKLNKQNSYLKKKKKEFFLFKLR